MTDTNDEPYGIPRTGTIPPEKGEAYRVADQAIAELVIEKQNAYGDSFGKAGEVMRLLYPDGVPPEKLDDALTVVRVLDKLFRVATRKDAFGESPWKDVQGYALLAVVRDATHAA